MQYIRGYKAYNKGLINRYGETHEVNKIYHHSGELECKKSGFHFCERLEDTLRYYDGMNDEIDICEVIGFGEIQEYYDSYYDYEIASSSSIQILKVLTREEIIEYASKLLDNRLARFIQGFRLTEEEIQYLYSLCPTSQIEKAIRYYQYGEEDVYGRK